MTTEPSAKPAVGADLRVRPETAVPPTTRPLPPAWRWARLGDVCTIQPGFAFDGSRFSRTAGTPLIRIRDLKTNECSERYDGPFDRRYMVNAGDLLVGMDGEFLCYEWQGPRGLLNQRLCRLFPKTDSLDLGFLFFSLNDYLKAIEHATSFTTVKHVSPKQIADILLPLPPLPDQLRIAAILREQMDAVRRAREAALARLEAARALPAALLRSVFESEEAKQWAQVRLGEACKPISGGTPSKDNPAYWNGTVPWFAPQHMKAFRLERSDQHVTSFAITNRAVSLVPGGSVLVVVRGMILVRDVPIALANRDLVINQDMKALVPIARLNPLFLAYFLKARRDDLLEMVSSSAHGTQKLETSKLLAVEVPLPPMGVQHRVAESLAHHLAAANAAAACSQAQLAAIDALPHALLRRAFAGQL